MFVSLIHCQLIFHCNYQFHVGRSSLICIRREVCIFNLHCSSHVVISNFKSPYKSPSQIWSMLQSEASRKSTATTAVDFLENIKFAHSRIVNYSTQ